MKLINRSEQEYIPATKTLSLDELFDLAGQFGRLDTGGMSGKEAAEIKMNRCGSDFIVIRCKEAPTLKQNIAECIDRARKISDLYASL